jgi:hypothetical protein
MRHLSLKKECEVYFLAQMSSSLPSAEYTPVLRGPVVSSSARCSDEPSSGSDDSDAYSVPRSDEDVDPHCEGPNNDVQDTESFLGSIGDTMIQDLQDSTTDPGQIGRDRTGSDVRKPPNVYDFKAKNTYSSRDWVVQWVRWTELLNNTPGMSDRHPSKKKDELTLLEMLLDDPNYLPGWNCVPDVERAELHLMNRLNQIKGCPLFVYDHIVSWAKEWLYNPEERSLSNDMLTMMRSREELLNSSVTFAHTEKMKPVIAKILLPRCRKNIDITSMSYLGNLYSILTNQNLVNDNTLLLNGPTPYDDPSLGQEDYEIDDFNTGTRYVKAWKHMKRHEIDFPLGDVFFVDKSVYDRNDRLTAEPVNHTNSLMRCVARNQDSAWSSLGSIPPNKNHGHFRASDKIVDYHACLSFLLSEYMAQQKDRAGILWPLSYQGKMFMVRFRPYVLACLGDTPGQNVMTGKISGTNRLCRYCDIEKHCLSDPFAEFKHMTLKWQQEIQSKGSERRTQCYYHVDVIWNKLNFGNDPRGIHANVPGEILHVFQKGFYIRLAECLATVPCLSMKARKIDRRLLILNENEERANSTTNKATSKATTRKTAAKKTKPMTAKAILESDLIKKGVFGGAFGKMVDVISVIVGLQLSRQSDRNICRVNFPRGIMSRTKTTASEQQGLTFLMNVILCSTWAAHEGGLRDRLGDERTGGFIQVMENLLCLEELLKIHPGKSTRCLMKSDLKAVASYTRYIMYKMTDVAHRKTGFGFNLIKFHLLVHMVDDDIKKYGLPRNVSGSAGESQFKKNFKLPATTTQKREQLFDQQVAERHHQHVTIEKCMQRLERIDDFLSVAAPRETQTCNPNTTFGAVLDSVLDDNLRRPNEVSAHLLSEGVYQMLHCNTGFHVLVNGKKVFNVPQNTDPEPGIVFNGKIKSARGKFISQWCCENADSSVSGDNGDFQLVGSDGKPVSNRGFGTLHDFNDSFRVIFGFLKPIFESNEHARMSLFTMLQITDEVCLDAVVTFRADPFCRVGLEARHDWALFEWGDDGQVPGMILCFLFLNAGDIKRYNETIGASGNANTPCITETGKYAMIHSLDKSIPGLMEPSNLELDPDDVMQSNSILLFYGKKELDGVGVPIVRLVHVDCIVRPLIVIPDFSPSFDNNKNGVNIDQWITHEDRKHAYTIVRPRDHWHMAFLELAHAHYNKKLKTGEEIEEESDLETEEDEEEEDRNGEERDEEHEDEGEDNFEDDVDEEEYEDNRDVEQDEIDDTYFGFGDDFGDDLCSDNGACDVDDSEEENIEEEADDSDEDDQ